MHALGDALALIDGALQDRRVDVHVGLLAAGARAAVGDVDLHVAADLLGERAQGDAVARIAGQRHHRLDRAEVDLEGRHVRGARIGLDDPLADGGGVEAALLDEVTRQ